MFKCHADRLQVLFVTCDYVTLTLDHRAARSNCWVVTSSPLAVLLAFYFAMEPRKRRNRFAVLYSIKWSTLQLCASMLCNNSLYLDVRTTFYLQKGTENGSRMVLCTNYCLSRLILNSFYSIFYFYINEC